MTHLTVSYSTSTPAAGSASATGSAAPFGGQVQGDGSLGFLTALIDQLLAGSAAGQIPTPTTDATGATGATAIPTPIPLGTTVDPGAILTATAPTTPDTTAPTADPTAGNIATLAAAIDPSTLTAATTAAPTEAAPLVKSLTKALAQLKSELEAGQKPDPDLLKKLGDTAQALAALIAAPATPAPATTAPATTTPPAPATTSLPVAAPVIATDPTAVPPGASNNPQPTPALPPAQALSDFAQQLQAMSQQLAPTSAHVAAQLQTLATRLEAAATDPQLSVQLTANTNGQPSALQALVRSLVPDTAPAISVQASALAATPQFAPPRLSLTPTTTEDSKSSGDNSAPPSTTASLGATSSKPATPPVASNPSDTKPDTSPSKPEAKLIAAATASDKSTDPATDPAAMNANAAPAVAAPVAAPRAIPAAYQTATANPINMGQVAFEMVHQLQQGSSRFNIRLDPPELGRVDVRMHVDATGTVNARLTVDRSETLDMFQRDRGSLEKALTQAGLDSGKTNLEFSLRQNPFAGMTGGDQRQSGAGTQNTGARFSLAAGSDDTSPAPTISLYRGVASPGGVNLFV